MASTSEGAKAPTNDGATSMVSPVSEWLPIFLSTKYFVPCDIHPHVKKSKCNVFCFKCQGPALCKECVSMGHENHPTLTLRKVSNKVAVVTCELIKAKHDINLKGVSVAFKANGHEHTFLSPMESRDSSKNVSEPSSKKARLDSNKCLEYCEKKCRVHPLFCSLSCKLKHVGIGSFEIGSDVDHKEIGEAIPDNKPSSARRGAKLKSDESSKERGSKLEVTKGKGPDGSESSSARRGAKLKWVESSEERGSKLEVTKGKSRDGSSSARRGAKLKSVESSEERGSKLEVTKGKGRDGSSDEHARCSRREVEDKLRALGGDVTVDEATGKATISMPRVPADVDIIHREQVIDLENKVAKCAEDWMKANEESVDEVEVGEVEVGEVENREAEVRDVDVQEVRKRRRKQTRPVRSPLG